MSFRIVLVSEAADDLRRLNAFYRTAVKDAIEQHLRHQPALLSKSRIKRLKELESPQYRLRVGHLRIFYDISGDDVVVLSILSKEESVSWLREKQKE
jgi:mRNA-degrading endonuclease RelE of RelBE toxin-antitoxin system